MHGSTNFLSEEAARMELWRRARRSAFGREKCILNRVEGRQLAQRRRDVYDAGEMVRAYAVL